MSSFPGSQQPTPAVRQILPITVPNVSRTGFAPERLSLDLPAHWQLTASNQKERQTSSECTFVFTLDPLRQAQFFLQIHSIGDALKHAPQAMLSAHKDALARSFWLRSFQGQFVLKAGEFEPETNSYSLYKSMARVSYPPRHPLLKFWLWLIRRPPDQLRVTQSFKLFRFQASITTITPPREQTENEAMNQYLAQQVRAALVRYATGRVM